MSANLGIAVYPADGDNFETVLRNADMALYTAKRKEQPFAIFSQISQS
ncbi:diguanylate cyclase [Pseudothermotoga sp.]